MLRDWLQRENGVPVLAGLAAMALVALLQIAAFTPLDRLGMQLFDAYQAASPREYRDAPVRVVDIDADSIDKLGQWPWPRSDLARLNRLLGEAGASAIAYDIVLAEPDRTSPARVAQGLEREGADPALVSQLATLEDHDAIFSQSLAESPVVLGMILETDDIGRPFAPKAGFSLFQSPPVREMLDYKGATQSLPQFVDAAAGVGSLTHQSDGDGIVRQIPLIAKYDGQLVPSLSLEAMRVARGEGQSVAVYGSGSDIDTAGAAAGLRIGSLEIPSTADGRIWVYYTREQKQRIVPAWKVLTGAMTEDQLRAEFAGKIVYLGTSAAGLRDLVSTPLGREVPGVMVHAQATEQMLLGEHLVRPDWAPGLELALVLLLGGGLALILPRMGATYGALLGIGGIAAVAAGSWLAFSRAHYLLDPLYPSLAIALVYTLQTVLSFYREERKRAYIRNAFDKYLSPEMVKQIAADPAKLELGGEEREMTVMMCDIRGFSRISEQYSPQEVIDFLIEFLTPMSDILLSSKATLDKYMGDAILAFWNAPLDDPDHPQHAARAALQMVEALDELNRTMPAKQGRPWPGDVRIGIGLNTGICCVGNMGSRRRLNYSLIGDTVNLAARLEGQTKQYGTPIVLGSGLARHLDGFALLELDRIRVVGRDRPDTIFALLGDESFAAHDALHSLAEAHGLMLAAYRSADWDEAARLLEEYSDRYVALGLDKLNALFWNRVAELRKAPPQSGWDGVFQATNK